MEEDLPIGDLGGVGADSGSGSGSGTDSVRMSSVASESMGETRPGESMQRPKPNPNLVEEELGRKEFGFGFEFGLGVLEGLMGEEERLSGLLGGVKEQHQDRRNPGFFRPEKECRSTESAMDKNFSLFFSLLLG